MRSGTELSQFLRIFLPIFAEMSKPIYNFGLSECITVKVFMSSSRVLQIFTVSNLYIP